MTSSTATRPNPTQIPTQTPNPGPASSARPALAHHLAPRLLGAALALGVAYIHVKDQGGFPGDKAPAYMGIGFYLLEATGLVAAVALLVGLGKHALKAWALTIGVAVGPLVGFALTRGPGLPDAMDDKGNWTETLGVVSLVVEGLLLVIAATVLARSRRVTS